VVNNSMLRLPLGAELQRCVSHPASNAALDAEVTSSNDRSANDELAPLRSITIPLTAILIAVLLSTSALAENAADIYKDRCAACHGATGSGDTMLGRNLKLRSLASDEVQKKSDDELATIISKGKNRMPAFDHKLTKNQILDMVKRIRSLRK
jgi:mono/diheme cytochrome c family protein